MQRVKDALGTTFFAELQFKTVSDQHNYYFIYDDKINNKILIMVEMNGRLDSIMVEKITSNLLKSNCKLLICHFVLHTYRRAYYQEFNQNL